MLLSIVNVSDSINAREKEKGGRKGRRAGGQRPELRRRRKIAVEETESQPLLLGVSCTTTTT